MVMGQGTRHRLAEDRSAGTSYGALGEAEGGERCARADFAAVGCDDSSDGAYSNWGLRGGNILISLSWYCDCATGELTEAEPEEAEGDDILVCC